MRLAVEQALTLLLALEEERAVRLAPYLDQIEALKATIASKISQIEMAMDDATDDLGQEIAAQIVFIEREGVKVGETVKVTGPHGSISSVYYKPSYKWDKAKLLGFAAAHPELMTIAEEVPASVQIRHGK